MLPLPRRLRLPRGVRDDEIAHLLEDPREVVLFDREAIEVRRRVEPVDRVELAVADRELDRVHVVPERVGETDRVQDRTRAQIAFDRTTDDVTFVERSGGVVADRDDILPADRDAADVVLPLDELLKDHRLRPVPRRKSAGLVVRPDELLFRVDAIDVLPSAAGVRLEDPGETPGFDE